MLRLRRLRQAAWIRDIINETVLTPQDLIWPVFVVEGSGQRQQIASMPGVERYSIDVLKQEVQKAADLGIPAVALFPVVPQDKKTANGDEALNADNLICRALDRIKNKVPQVGLIADVALDPYTAHGHDGLLSEGGEVLNDETVDILSQQAVLQAQAGADIIAPSDMMDGRVLKIRQSLDKAGFKNTMILSYAVKYASAFYGPFREAITSAGNLQGDKKTYQMNPANRKIALREAGLDVQEGADILMVKPGLPYLDVIRDISQNFDLPVFGYHVSGEYAMLKAAAQNGWLDYDACLEEKLLAFKRAGCSGILTYAAREMAAKLN